MLGPYSTCSIKTFCSEFAKNLCSYHIPAQLDATGIKLANHCTKTATKNFANEEQNAIPVALENLKIRLRIHLFNNWHHNIKLKWETWSLRESALFKKHYKIKSRNNVLHLL